MRIDEALLNEAKAYAARNGRSLTSVMEDALRQLLNRSADAAERPHVSLPVSGAETGPKLTWAEIEAILELEDLERYLGGPQHADA
ncbi:hypothetical protein [Nonomuraea cavernae]|uniref:Uncharacterized protein n=1 Tax=Nonomuraea cavernae TaxID=2045107 RepID=A0A917YR62_9ACTN|nr:hypothetical protein [Nonomuraea cavernae]GGO64615.1 hypothetical protein GCM10012289_14360 [Nonomuraea cavernae]